MNEDEIRKIIEQQIPSDSGVSQNNIEDIVQALRELKVKKDDDGTANDKDILEERLKQQLVQETDWRKKASIAAKIISSNL